MTELQPKDVAPAPAESAAPWALDDLPPFPAVATQILQLVSKEDVSLGEVGTLIGADPVFAADVLQIANSALFALSFHVRTIAHAIAVLGTERVKALSLTRALGNYLSPALKVEALRRCWQHSLAGAILAERLARTCGINRDLAYTAGLLRDIGRLALLVKYPHPYADVLFVTQENGFDLMATERDLFDVDHCQAGYWLTEKMQIPPELREVVARHHEDSRDAPFGLVQLVHVADLMSEALGFGVLTLAEPPSFAEVLEQLPEPVRRCFAQDPEQLRTEVGSKMQFLCPASK
ncbi:MAG: HDOD domain-containing protein [Bryobacteraceae bacterium]|jgi:putative nucleotidyltransferase with HDIG domain